MVDQFGDGERAGPRPLLRIMHSVAHARATEPALRLGEPRVGEQRIGLRDCPARVRVHAR
jgi:hypothetical protein